MERRKEIGPYSNNSIKGRIKCQGEVKFNSRGEIAFFCRCAALHEHTMNTYFSNAWHRSCYQSAFWLKPGFVPSGLSYHSHHIPWCSRFQQDFDLWRPRGFLGNILWKLAAPAFLVILWSPSQHNNTRAQCRLLVTLSSTLPIQIYIMCFWLSIILWFKQGITCVHDT